MTVGILWGRKAVFFSEAVNLEELSQIVAREFPGISQNALILTTDEYNDGKNRSCEVVLLEKQ